MFRRSDDEMRYVDKGKLIAAFAQRVLVACPKCSSQAVVTCRTKSVMPFIPKDAKARCSNCSFQLGPGDDKWYGPMDGEGRAPCPNCGFKWLKKRLRVATPNQGRSKISLVCCPACEKEVPLSIEWSVERFGTAVDPVFGLPLWLQTSCRGEVFWAFNPDHLENLKQFISARVRERVVGYHWSTFQRLPKWVVSAKNRDEVIRCITRLQVRARSICP